MEPDHDRIESILVTALEIQSEIERQAYIRQACGGDTSLQSRVDELIENHFQAGSFLNVQDHSTPGSDCIQEQPGSMIGPYKLLQKIGEGGMGIVFLAEQAQPVRRRVAVKVIRAGIQSAQVVARFEQERQALAMMDHPNIARVIDGGVTADGRPYFAMELVNGIPITQYCDQQRLSVNERIALFTPVCQAVQHAHQKGVVHRDLKPSNVLIALYDGKPIPKVIDFGVAKAFGQRLTERTMFTDLGQIVGTLEYMAPEQAELNNLDIDTRADIYSLGVLLYELLTGTPPFTSAELKSAGLQEMIRIIKEVEPSKPSTRLTLSENLPNIAAQRRLEPQQLARTISGDLDWIIMKCLAKERARRYDTANGLAIELQRYLADEPVQARPPTALYRLGKLVRRHQVSAVATILVFSSLLGGIIGTTLALANANHQKRIALAAQQRESLAKQREQERADAEATERQRAELAKAEGEMIVDFLRSDLIGQAGSRAQATRQFTPTPDLTIREALDRAAAAVGEKFQGKPVIEAAIRKTIGDSYLELGLYEKATEQLELAVEIRKVQLGLEHFDTLNAKDSLAQAFRGNSRFAEAIELLEQNSASRRENLGPEDLSTLATRNNLAVVYRDTGRAADALAAFEQVSEARQKSLGPNDPATLVTLHNLASMYLDAGKTNEAIAALEKVYAAKAKVLGPEHPDTLPALQNLAVTYWKAKQLDQSIPRFEQLVQLYRKVHGDEHLLTLGAKANLGVNYRDAGRLAEAITLLEEARRAGAGRIALNWVGRELSIAYELAGDIDQQIALEQALLAETRILIGSDRPRLASTLATAGATLFRLKQWDEAESVLRECVEIRESIAPDDWRTFNTKSLLGEALFRQSKFAEAEQLVIQGYEGMAERDASIPQGAKSRMNDALERLVQLYEAWGKPDEAAKWREALDRQQRPEAQPTY